MQNLTFTIKTSSKDKFITDIDLEKVIKKALNLKINQITFNWVDKELIKDNLNFYKKAVELQKKYHRPELQVANIAAVEPQYITNKAAEFFKQYNFVLELSITEDILNDSIITAINFLRTHNTEFTLIFEACEKNADKALSFYDKCKENNWNYLGFRPQKITGKTWGKILQQVTTKWLKKDTKKISVNIFDAVLFKMLLNKPEPATGLQKNSLK